MPNTDIRKTESGRILWISATNVLATLAVVFLHCNGIFWTFPEGSVWISANFIETACYWAVPVFYMISGATLLEYRKRYTTSIFFKKRAIRIVLPFISWTIIGALYQTIVGAWHYTGLRTLASDITDSKIIGIYWFFWPLFMLYLAIPLFSAVDEKLRNRVFGYLVGIGVLLIFILPFCANVLGIGYHFDLLSPMTSGYLVYLLAGYLLAKTELAKNRRYFLYFLGVVGWLLQFIGTHYLSVRAGEIIGTFKGYQNFPAFFQAIAVFVLIKNIPWERLFREGQLFIENASKYTFGVYLMHIYFVWQIPARLGISTASLGFRTIGAVGIFLLCLCICFVLSKIPVVRRLIGA